MPGFTGTSLTSALKNVGQGGGARKAEWQEAQRRATREHEHVILCCFIISLEELRQQNPVRDSGNRSVEMFYGHICVFFSLLLSGKL